ncbi:UNVERIFIED_CONTAM: Lysophospholipid acyltransferase LPEAT1 [Sesamum radiatum]|uniref:Lysophospholipid acyltransferase LPEAT1 n=1 Tax=Sesamum radiatum TaxID=300843 RepID=A0AAW2SHQ7_SESRA
MESELKDLAPKPAEPQPESDESPLLKSEVVSPAPQISISSQSIDEMEIKLYAPFVRHDVYGTMGRGKLPCTEKLLLGLGLVFLLPIRVVGGMTILFFYYVICRVCTAFLAPSREAEQEDYAHTGGWRRAVILQSGRYLSRAVLFVFGFYWISETRKGNVVDEQLNSEANEPAHEDQSEEVERPGAIVSNHVSYVDILYHMSASFPSFVAKRSVAKLPLVGLISPFKNNSLVTLQDDDCDMVKYVDKHIGSTICLGWIISCLQRESKSSDFKGVSEGTTTNGDYLLPFKTGAFLAKAPVLPVILRYPYQRFSPAWDSISGGNLILSDIGLAEKRVYHAALNGNISMPTVLHQKDD